MSCKRRWAPPSARARCRTRRTTTRSEAKRRRPPKALYPSEPAAGHSVRMRDRRDAAIAMAVVLLGCCGAALVLAGNSPPTRKQVDGSRRDGAAASSRRRAPSSQPDGLPGGFEVQAHRGGLGRVTESTLEAFSRTLEIGVTTLELDVRLAEDGHAVVTHDRRVSAIKCRDTRAAVPGDPEFPYVGDLIRRLSVAQIVMLDCGRQQLPGFPRQRVVANARMPLLSEVFALVECQGAD